MKPTPARWLLALLAPLAMVISASAIGIVSDEGGPAGPREAVACEDAIPPGQRESSYQEFAINPGHERVLDSIPLYPGCVQTHLPVSNGAGSFAAFWATASPALVSSFYVKELPAIGWDVTDAPREVAGTGGEPHMPLSFTKDEFSLTVDVSENPSKGDDLGNVYVLFRLRELSAEDSAALNPSPSVVAEDVRPCGADDLISAYASRNGAMMAIFNGYGFGNPSDTPCKLDGPPEVKLIDASGAQLPTVTTSQPPCPGSWSCIEMGPVVLAPGLGQIDFLALNPGQASILLVWRNHDGAIDCGSPRATKLRFTFSDGTQVEAAVPESENMAPCEGRVEIWGYGPVDGTDS